MNEMIDRIAAPIAMELAELTQAQRDAMTFPDDFVGDTIDRARCAAREVIKAMREPTEAMMREGALIMPDYDPSVDDAKVCWQAMIDSILEEKA